MTERENRQEPSLAAVVVNWNGGELVLRAVESLYEGQFAPVSVIVVDNNSQDGSPEAIRSRFPEVILIRNRRNVGFGRANNQGFEEALRRGAEFILLLNNDAWMEEGSLERLVDFIKAHPKAGGTSPLIVYAQQPDRVWFGGGVVRLWMGLVAHRGIRQPLSSISPHPRQSDYLTGCALLLRSQALREVGPFSPQYEIYGEDVDLSLRLRSAGWELWFYPRSKVYHQLSFSSGGALSPWKLYHRARSTALLMRRHLRWWQWLCALPLSFLTICLQALYIGLKGGKQGVISMIAGFASGLLSLKVASKYALPE